MDLKSEMDLCNNCRQEEFLLLIKTFQMTLEASGTLATGAKIKYLRTLVHGEQLCQIDTLTTEVGSITSDYFKSNILGLGTNFPPVNDLLKQNHAMRQGMVKQRGLKVRRYDARTIDLNKYVAVFRGEKTSNNICET